MAYNPTISEREAAAGLNLAGNDPMSGRSGGIQIPTIDEREAAAGLTLFGHSTTDPRFQFENKVKEIEDEIIRQDSLIRQDASRARRSAEKKLKDEYRKRINDATDTRDKRALKKIRDDLIQAELERVKKAEDTANEENINKAGTGDSIHEDSIDKTGSAPDNSKDNPAGGDDVPQVLEDYTETTVTICINGTPTTGTIFFKAS